MKIMRGLVFRTLLGAVACFLASCSAKIPTMTPEIQAQLLQSMRNGNAVLDCNLACAGTWGGNLQELRYRYGTQDWVGLATLVMAIGYQNDLAYFYLGRASEGLGADAAALKYYRIAGAIATGPTMAHKCNSTYNLCNGLRFPQDIVARMQIASANLQRQQAPRARPVQPVQARPADENWITPPPTTR